MTPVTALDTIRGLYDYHRWANHRLFDAVAALGEEAAARDLGKQFSVPTLRRMLTHIWEADWVWLARWKGTSPTRMPGEDVTSLDDLRARWDAVEAEQAAFLDGLSDADLAREVDYRNTRGRAFRAPLWALLQHVANHATHHRSEVATMVTMISGSPPPTDLVLYQLTRTGQA